MPCPFLSRLSVGYVRNYSETLLQYYGSYCPVMSKRLFVMGVNLNNVTPEASGQMVESGAAKAKPVAMPAVDVEKPNGGHGHEQLRKRATEADNDTAPLFVERREEQRDLTLIKAEKSNCPNRFAYERFFKEQIMKKKKDHSYRVFKKVNRLASDGMFPHALEYTEEEKPITVWCSNDYLGMSCHPKVKQAAARALEYHGAGAGGTRNISGNSIFHERLEARIAELHKKEAALLFTSCFVANDSTLFTLARLLPDCHIFSDAGNHASMIQGIRNSGVPKHIFRHNDVEHLRSLLQTVGKDVPKIVAFETVHSMSGGIAPLKQMLDVAHEYGGITFIDEVHAVGLYGDHGAGVGEQEHQLGRMDIITGTLGKAFGNIGGYIAGTANLVDMIRSYAAGFIFTTSLPPTVLCGALEAINILSSEEGRALRSRQQEKVKYLKYLLQREGFPVENTQSHIIPVRIGDPFKTTQASDLLMRQSGHYIQAINYPTVARGEEKLRLAPTPFHSYNMINTLVADMKKVWRSLELPTNEPKCSKQCSFCMTPNIMDFSDDIFKNTLPIIACAIPDCPKLVACARS